jgi:hypothetical protein
MMDALLTRATSLARAAQRRRLEDIASGMTARGFAVEILTDAVICRGRDLAQRWLGDPLLRFLGRSGT